MYISHPTCIETATYVRVVYYVKLLLHCTEVIDWKKVSKRRYTDV
jgi:hypothetical protein